MTEGRKLSDEELDRKLREWLRKKRENPYYAVIATSFAVVFGALGTWLFWIGRDGIYWLLPLPAVTFLIIVYGWLYFSRILVYVSETPEGELASFALSFTIIAALAIVASQGAAITPFWFIALIFPAIMWYLKCRQLKRSLSSIDKKNPLFKDSDIWIKNAWRFGALISLLGIIFPLAYKGISGMGYIGKISANITTAVLTAGVTLVFVLYVVDNFSVYENGLRLRMTTYLHDIGELGLDIEPQVLNATILNEQQQAATPKENKEASTDEEKAQENETRE